MPKSSRSGQRGSQKWFVRIRGSYLPVTWQGYVSYVPYVWLIVLKMQDLQDFIESCADTGCRATSVSHQTISTVLYFVGLVAIMNWFARKHS